MIEAGGGAPTIDIRRAEALDDVETFLERMFPGRDPATFNWLYRRGVCGPVDVFTAVESTRGDLVGVYSILPTRLQQRHGTVEIGQAFDAAVDPAYRGRRIFSRLMEHALRDVAAKYSFLVGFPNEQAIRAELRVGWKIVGHLESRSLPLRSSAIVRRIVKARPLRRVVAAGLTPALAVRRAVLQGTTPSRGLTLAPLDDWSPDLDAAVDAVKHVNPVMTLRTAEFVKWRLFGVPGKPYLLRAFVGDDRLQGYVALRHVGRDTEIVDLCVSPVLAPAALGLVADMCRRQGHEALHAQIATGGYLIPALRRLGFLRRRDVPVIAYPLRDPLEDIAFHEWFLSHADTDWI